MSLLCDSKQTIFKDGLNSWLICMFSSTRHGGELLSGAKTNHYAIPYTCSRQILHKVDKYYI